jgi:hypothetical protein
MSLNPAEIQNLLALKKTKLEEVAGIQEKMSRFLGGLPAMCGFETDLEGFLEAVRENFAKHRSTKQPGGAKKGKAAAKVGIQTKSSGRKVTDEIKQQIKSLFHEGKTTREIVKAVKISTAAVNNAKKELGLVKARKKPTSAPIAAPEPASGQSS